MATVFYDRTHGVYKVKYKDALTGKWAVKRLSERCQPPADPRDIPVAIRNLAALYDDSEPQSNPHIGASRVRLDDRLSEYVLWQETHLRPRSFVLLKDIAKAFGDYCRDNGVRYLDAVRPSVVKAFAASEIHKRKSTGKNLAPHVLKARLSLLGRMFTDAIDNEEYVGQNPIRAICRQLKSSKANDSPPKVLTPQEIDTFLTEIRRRIERPYSKGPSSKLPQWVEYIVIVMLNTGLRVDAAIHMEFSWVDANKINVPAERSKSTKPYSTVLNDKVRAIVDRRREELGPTESRIFPECRGGSWLYARLNYIAKALVRKGAWTQDKGHYNHILRHTFITTALNEGVPLVHVSKLAGHRSIVMTTRYDQSTYDQAIASAIGISIG